MVSIFDFLNNSDLHGLIVKKNANASAYDTFRGTDISLLDSCRFIGPVHGKEDSCKSFLAST